MEEIRRDIETYVRATREDPEPEFPDADNVWSALRAKLETNNQRTIFKRPARFCWRAMAAGVPWRPA